MSIAIWLGRADDRTRLVAIVLAALAVAAGLAVLTPAAGASAHCTQIGTPGPDVLHGGSGNDVLCGRGGDDTLIGRGGDDRLLGGPGDDLLLGGAGDDILSGGPGDDRMHGGPGNDGIRGGRGSDSCSGRATSTPRAACSGPGAAGGLTGSPAGTPSGGDTFAPVLDWLAVSPAYVDTSQGDSAIQFYVDAFDGQSGVASFTLEVQGPNGLWREVHISPADRQGSVYARSEPLPGGSAPGTYTVSSMTIVDMAGNRTTVDSAELAQDGYDRSVEVIDQPDTSGPALTNFSLSPGHVNSSSAPTAVDLSAHVTDALTGAHQVTVDFRFPNDSPPPTTYGKGLGLAAGTIHDGVWNGQLRLPRGAAPGTYQVTGIQLYDQAGNHTDYDRSQLSTMGFPVDFDQDGAGDTTDPSVLDVTHSPDVLHASHGAGTVTFSFHVSDDLSGLGDWTTPYSDDIEIGIDPPSGPASYTGTAFTHVSGTDTDGVWNLGITLPANAPTGTYTVRWVMVLDRAANETDIQGSALTAKGWDLTFENQP